MRKLFRLPQYFLIITALLISSKSFATCSPSPPITSSGTYTGDIVTCGDNVSGALLVNGNGAFHNSNIINMTGNINTQGSGARGIQMQNIADTNETLFNTNTFNMTGDIHSTGPGGQGIFLQNASGISASSNNINTVNMLGSISTTGDFAQGIELQNDVVTYSINTVNIVGSISSIGQSSHGILLDNYFGSNNSNIINMTGNISTNGVAAFGIYLNNFLTNTITNTVNMTGNISTNRVAAFGIYLNNDNGTNTNNTVNMAGNITTNGEFAYGIYLHNAGNNSNNTNTVNITGNITTTAGDASGVYLINFGSNSNTTNTVNMTGRISSIGYAIYARNYASSGSVISSNTIQLNKGSSVIGEIVGEGGNNFLKLNLGAGASYNFTAPGFLGNDLNGRPYLADPAAAGIGNVATASQSMYERTTAVSQSLDDRLRTYDLKQNTDQPYWINTYYTDSGRGGEGLTGSNLNFNQYRSGITAGFNLNNSYTPTELVVNYEYGKLNIDDGNQSIQSNSVMAGFLFPDITKVLGGTLSAKAMLGYADNRGNRRVLDNMNVNGFENVTASYNSTQFIIGPSWTKTLYQTDKVILDTLLGADLNTQRIDSYTEGSNLFHWNARTMNQIQARMQLGLKVQPLSIPLHFYGRVGFEYRDLISGENQKYAITGLAVNYSEPNQQSSYGTANVGAYYRITNSINAYAQTKYYTSDKNIDSLTTSVGISGQF